MSRGFANPLTELAEFEQLQESLKKKKIRKHLKMQQQSFIRQIL